MDDDLFSSFETKKASRHRRVAFVASERGKRQISDTTRARPPTRARARSETDDDERRDAASVMCAGRKDAEALGRHFAKTLRMKEDEEPPADSKKTRKKKPPSIPTPLREEKKGKSLDLRETIERLRREKNRAAKEEEFCDKEGHHCDETEEEKISSKNSRQRRMESRKEKRERAADASAREQNDKTVTAEDLRKKMKDEGDDSAEALNTSQESMEKSMKKKREEGNEKKGAEEGPPGYTQPKYSDYLAIKAKEEEKEKVKKEYTSPFSHILQSAPTTLPPSFDTPQGARGEGFVLGDRDKVPTSLFNSNSTWQGSAAYLPPTKLAPSFIPRTPSKADNNNNNKQRERIPRDEKEDHLTANDLYKTELCRSWTETGECRYNDKCQFAHGRDELRCVVRHPKYKTQVCRTFMSTGQCPYGSRCRFIHEKLPEKGVLGTLTTQGHYVITEDWKPGGGKDPLCLRKNISGESGDIDVTWDDKKEDDTPKRLGIFRHITHDESLSLSEGQPSSPSSPTSAEEGEIRGALNYQQQQQQHEQQQEEEEERADQHLEFEGFAGPLPRTPDSSKRYF